MIARLIQIRATNSPLGKKVGHNITFLKNVLFYNTCNYKHYWYAKHYMNVKSIYQNEGSFYCTAQLLSLDVSLVQSLFLKKYFLNIFKYLKKTQSHYCNFFKHLKKNKMKIQQRSNKRVNWQRKYYLYL